MTPTSTADTEPGAGTDDLRSAADVRRAVAAHFTARGMGPEVLGSADFAHLVDEGATGVLRFALSRPAVPCRVGR